MQLAPYFSFDGTCEEALAFYSAIFDGKIVEMMRFGDSPGAADMPPEQRRRVMHASFEAPGVRFMASDGGETGETMRGVAMSLATSDIGKGQRVFDALAAGGTITSPYVKQFWGATFGMLVDRFGVSWMVNAG